MELGGSNPDVDTRADLLELAWADRVRRDHAQVDRHREVPDGTDFYGPVTGLFRADPRRTDEPALDRLLELAEPGDTLARHRRRRGSLRAAARAPGARGHRGRALGRDAGGPRRAPGRARDRRTSGRSTDRWPPEPGSAAVGLRADVALIAHLGYDIEAIGPFLDAMEAAAGRRCVAVLMERQPSSLADPFWPPIHGEERIRLPALNELVELLEARGREPSVVTVIRETRGFETLDEIHGFVRRQLWLAEGGAADRRLAALVRERAVEVDGRWTLPGRVRFGWASSTGRRRPGATRSQRSR